MILRDILRHLTVSVILVVAVAALATTRADVDLWGHTRFGLDILRDLRLESSDPYSFTSDRPWINHEWLSEVIMAVAWRWAGSPGLLAIKLACVLGALALVSLSLRMQGVALHDQLPLLGLAVAGMLPRVNHIRPQLFSVLLYAGLLLAFTKSEQERRSVLLWCLPILALWANLHGGWIVGLGAVWIWTAGLAIEQRQLGFRAFLMPGFIASAAALVTLCNPYGLGLWAFLLETVRFGREAIEEWGPIWTYPHLVLLWGLFLAMLGVAVWQAKIPRVSARTILLIFWCVASARVSRLDAFFALSVIVLIGPAMISLIGSSRRSVHVDMRFGFVIVAAVMLLLATPARRVLTCVTLYSPWWPEPEAVAYMHTNSLAGKMVTFFRWGEYGIWHMPRSIKVSIDGRRETVYSDRTIRGHIQMYRGTQEGLAYLDELNADYVWLPRELPLTRELERRGWLPIFSGSESVLFARPDVERDHPRFLNSAGPRVPDRCFPGP
jgi:hypothetical protein